MLHHRRQISVPSNLSPTHRAEDSSEAHGRRKTSEHRHDPIASIIATTLRASCGRRQKLKSGVASSLLHNSDKGFGGSATISVLALKDR